MPGRGPGRFPGRGRPGKAGALVARAVVRESVTVAGRAERARVARASAAGVPDPGYQCGDDAALVGSELSGTKRAVLPAGGKLELVAKGSVGANGLLNAPELSKTFAPGGYVAVFHVAGFYRAQGVPLPAVPFLDVVRFHFGISEPAQHYHLPFKCTPWGYSCFRGA